MKLVRHGKDSLSASPALLLPNGAALDLKVELEGADFDGDFFAAGGIEKLKKIADAIGGGAKKKKLIDGSALDYCAPICRPPNIICVGLNYRAHAAESGMPVPSIPVLFAKHTASYAGPFDDIVIPRGSEQTDYEVELAVVIGKEAHNVAEADALSYVLGYTILNDVSERHWQLKAGSSQWDGGKGAPTFSPIGPYLVTPDEVGDPQSLNMSLSVNGEVRQSSTTADMIFSVAELIAFASTRYKLLPGDIISTGTPFGVGLSFDPPRYLLPGDVVELSIDKLGAQKQLVTKAG
jgi:2,4-didehydro-3-deoxy-L-rhamnonate hydrolase